MQPASRLAIRNLMCSRCQQRTATGDIMLTSTLITIALAALLVLSLPMWKYTRMWGGGTVPPIFMCCVLGAHLYSVMFGH
jgi:hypothetical protein